MPGTTTYRREPSERCDYRGATVPASFGDVRAEYFALRGRCGLCDFGWRSKLVLTGADRVRWLNGMITNNVRDLQTGRGVYAFVLNAQGRILADLYAFNRGEYLLIETDAAQLATLKALFEQFIIMDDVQVTDLGGALTSLAVVGPEAAAALAQSGLELSGLGQLETRDLTWNSEALTAVRLDEAVEAFELWLSPAAAQLAWARLVEGGARPCGARALELLRVWSGRPLYGQDIRDRDLPQETSQERALSFSKGCYVGQEIVERIHARALLHRSFTGFTIDQGELGAGAVIEREGRKLAEITSVAELPTDAGSQRVALG